MKRRIHTSILFLILFFPLLGWSQSGLNNPSFEGPPQEATTPQGWEPCRLGTTPDMLPGPWDVATPARHGNSFMGLITRSDGTWESVGQLLVQPLEASQCYTFQLYLARSDKYANYNMPVRLRIWASPDKNTEPELLAETSAIDHEEWKKYEFSFTPRRDSRWFVLEAYFASGYFFNYNGNILLDHCSEILPCRRASLTTMKPSLLNTF